MPKALPKFLIAAGAMAGLFAVATAPAHATAISIGLQEAGTNGGAITTVATDSAVAGFASFAGTYGNFSFNSLSGTGSPIITAPAFETTSLNVSSALGGTITVYITETGLTSPTGVNNFLSSFTANQFSGAVTSVTEETLISTSNLLYTGSLLASQVFTGLGTASLLNATPSLGTYSETAEYIVTTTGVGHVNNTINFTAVPEPASLGLLGMGLVGLGVLRQRRRA